MKPVENRKKRKLRPEIGITVAACVLCLAAGAAIPLLREKTQSDGMEKIQSVYDILKDNWYYADKGEGDETIEQRLAEQAIEGMSTLEEDPHTNYMDLETAKRFSDSLAGSNVGIGITYFVNEDGRMEVRDVFVNSTAEKAGIQSGDILKTVGKQDAQTADPDQIVQTIKNYDGQKLPVMIERDGETIDMTLEPGQFDTTVICTQDGDTGIITLNSFSEDSGREFEEAVQRLKKAGATRLVLDLRNNTGGYLKAAQSIASSLLPSGSVIFQEELKDGTVKKTEVDAGADPVSFEKIVVLQNGSTASASEVLIGALKDNLDNVTTVGTTSYGKGTEQVSVPFSDGTSLKYTIAQWMTPDGTSINGKGFEADETVQLPIERRVSYRELAEGETIEADTVSDNGAALQVFLNYLGYPTVRTDNYVAPETAEQVMLFQEDNGFEPTGTADKATFDKLCELVIQRMNRNQKADDTQLQRALELAKEG